MAYPDSCSGGYSQRELRIFPQVQHVVVVRVAAHAHGDELDERRTEAGAGALDGPVERRGDLVGIRAVDRNPGNPVACGFVGEHADGGLLAHGRRERRLVVLHAEDRRELPHRAEIDRLVPLAERRSALAHERDRHAAAAIARECERHARERERADAERRGSRQDAVAHVAHVQVLAVHGRAGLPHLRRHHGAHRVRLGPHRERRAEIANQRRDDVAAPLGLLAEAVAAPQPDRGRVNRFLSERSKSLALERGVAVPHLATGEERLEAIVGRARQHHAAQDLAALVRRQGLPDRGASQESVARIHELVDRKLETLRRVDAGRRLERLARRDVLQARAQLAGEALPHGVDRRRITAHGSAARVERRAHRREREGKPLGDEGFEPAGEIGRWMDRGGPGHGYPTGPFVRRSPPG